MHRLDRINAKKPAILLDFQSLTLGSRSKQYWPVFLCDTSKWATATSDGSPAVTAEQTHAGRVLPV